VERKMELIVLGLGGCLAVVLSELFGFIRDRHVTADGALPERRLAPSIAAMLEPNAAAFLAKTIKPSEEAPTRSASRAPGTSAARSRHSQLPARKGNRYANLPAVAFVATTTLASISRPVGAAETCPTAFDQIGAITSVQADMFAALENEDQLARQRSTVRDFLAFEGGRRYGRTAFFEEIKHADANGHHFSWSVTSPRVEVDCIVATLIYVNQGYVLRGSSWSPASWLEAATFRYAAGKWRAVFVESMRENVDGGSSAASLAE
jgi:hypothetical protein